MSKVMVDEEKGILVPVYKDEDNKWIRIVIPESTGKHPYSSFSFTEVHPALVLDKETAEERYPEYCI